MTAFALSFRDTKFDIIDRNGQPWLRLFQNGSACKLPLKRGFQIGSALEYADPSMLVRVYSRNADEFTDAMTALIEMETNGGKQQVRIFSLRGCHLLAMLARTQVAKEFRKWVLDILDREVVAPKFRPEKTRKALPGGLTVEQQDAIKALVKSRVEVLPHDKQAKAAITCWSAVKSKFGVSYKEVPATNFCDVLSLVARLPLDGELLKAPKGKYHFPLEFWQPTNRIGRSGWITWTELTRIESADLPLSNLLSRLAADGHDVEGARVEYRAMRLLLESMHWTIADIAARVNAIPRLGLSVAF